MSIESKLVDTSFTKSKAEQWISQFLDQDFHIADLQDGFVFLQLLSLIAPEHVDILQYISDSSNINYWNTLYCSLESNPGLAAWVNWNALKQHVQSLINFTNIDIPINDFYEPVTKILDHFFQFMSSSNYIYSSKKEKYALKTFLKLDNDVAASISEKNLTFKDKDPNFLHGLFCLLSYCKEIVHEQSKAYQEICDLINNLDLHDDFLPKLHFEVLQRGHIYNLIVNQLYPKSISHPVISSLQQTPPDFAYESILHLNSVRELESVHDQMNTHIDICVHLVKVYQHQLSDSVFPNLHQYLQTLPGYTPQLHTPFDLEDGFLVLLSLITTELQDFSDLFIDLEHTPYWESLQEHFHCHTYLLPPEFQSDSGRLITLCMLSRMFLTFTSKNRASKKIRIKKARLKLINPSNLVSDFSDSAVSIPSSIQDSSRPSTSQSSLLSNELFRSFEKPQGLEPPHQLDEVLSFISLYEGIEEPVSDYIVEEPDDILRIITLSPTTPYAASPVAPLSLPSTPVLKKSQPMVLPLITSNDSMDVPLEHGNTEECTDPITSDCNSKVMVFSNESFRPGKPKPILGFSKPASLETLGKTSPYECNASLVEVNQTQSQKNSPQQKTNQKDTFITVRSIPKHCNKRLILNALQICLAGSVNSVTREEVLEELKKSDAVHFVILLKGAKHHGFKGLYIQSLDPLGILKVTRIYGNGPKEILEDNVEVFFKYDSGSRSFKAVPTKTFSSFIHATALNRSGSAK